MYKTIKQEDHIKVFNNIYPSSNMEEFKGCLFIYDDELSIACKRMLGEKLTNNGDFPLELWMDISSVGV